MFKRVAAAITVIVSVALNASAQKVVDPYDYPAISEVQWIDIFNWSIELDNAMWPTIEKSCSTSVIKLYLASSKKTYSTRIYFNDAGLGVVTRTSIVPPMPDGQPVKIMTMDTIVIPDPENSFSSTGWRCPVENPTSGHSLIGIQGGRFIRSARSSIGTRGDYTTTHQLHVVDRDRRPVVEASVYYKDVQDDGCSYPIYITFRSLGATDAGGVLTLKAVIGAGIVVYVSDGVLDWTNCVTACSVMMNGVNLDPPCQMWQNSYIDDAVECSDTLMLKPNYQKVKVVDIAENPVTAITPRMKSRAFGKSIGPGEFLFRFFEQSGGYPIVFYRDADSSVVAACSCWYVDTRDTMSTTVVVMSTVAAPRACTRKSFTAGKQQIANRQELYDIRGRSILSQKISPQMVVVRKSAGIVVNLKRGMPGPK